MQNNFWQSRYQQFSTVSARDVVSVSTSRSRDGLKTHQRLVSVSGFNVSCPSLVSAYHRLQVRTSLQHGTAGDIPFSNRQQTCSAKLRDFCDTRTAQCSLWSARHHHGLSASKIISAQTFVVRQQCVTRDEQDRRNVKTVSKQTGTAWHSDSYVTWQSHSDWVTVMDVTAADTVTLYSSIIVITGVTSS